QMARTDFVQYLDDLRDALTTIRIGGVDYREQQRRLTRFLQRRAERRHEVVRPLANETDGIRQQRKTSIRQFEPAHGWIERREQLVRRVGTRASESIK